MGYGLLVDETMETQDTTAKISVRKFAEQVQDQIETLQHSVDVLMQDREILVDTHATVVALKEVIRQNQRHTDTIVKDVKADIVETGKETQEKVEAIHESVEQNGEALIEKIEQKPKIIIKKESLWQRVRGIFRWGVKK